MTPSRKLAIGLGGDMFAPKNRTPRPGKFRNRLDRKRFKVGDLGGGASMQQANDMAQAAILALAQPMMQPLAPVTYNASNTAQGQVINIIPNNVGLNTKLVIEVSGTIAVAGAETLTRTPLGLANFFSNITLTDLNNVQRVNTTGWHLYLLGSLRNRGPLGAAYATDAPAEMGSTYLTQNGPASVSAAGAQNFRFFVEVPIAYNDQDLRGAIYAAVTSAQWRLTMTVNPNFIVPSTTTDAVLASYQSDAAGVGSLTNVTITVWQEYLDQLPRQNGNPVLPALSLAYNYLLTNTTMTGMAQGQDFPVFYPNYRTFLSTCAIYNQAGTLNAGTDINYLAVQVANMTYLKKPDAFRTQFDLRNMIGTDFPRGCYAFDHRRKPIDTNQYGNTSFVLNPSSVAVGSALFMGYEMLAIQSQAINSGSLQGG